MEGITVLGTKVEGTLTPAQLETFDVPKGVSEIIFETDELLAVCPVTGQPDRYDAQISYGPAGSALESKTLKLYLNSFKNEGIFGEHLAAQIADDLNEVLQPSWLSVTLTQGRRGGLDMTVTATPNDAEYGATLVGSK